MPRRCSPTRVAQLRHLLEALRRYRPYLLTEPEERILTEKSLVGPVVPGRGSTRSCSAACAPIDGEEQSTRGRARAAQDADRDVRRTAAEAVTEGLAAGLRTRAFVFNALLLDKSIDYRLRGYPTGSPRATSRTRSPTRPSQALVDAVVSATTSRSATTG